MAVVNANSGPVASGAQVERTSGTHARAGASGLRPVNPVAGIQRDFSLMQPQAAQVAQKTAQPVLDRPTARQDDRKSGTHLLSTDVQLLLTETRAQEASAPSPAPSSVGVALSSYSSAESSVRETIRNNHFASQVSNNNQLPSETDDNEGSSVSAQSAISQFI